MVKQIFFDKNKKKSLKFRFSKHRVEKNLKNFLQIYKTFGTFQFFNKKGHFEFEVEKKIIFIKLHKEVVRKKRSLQFQRQAIFY